MLVEQLAVRFSRLTRQAIVEYPMVLEARACLDYYVGKLPMFLLSATPQNELNFILTERCLIGYFREAFGVPIDKAAILKQIMADERIPPEAMLFIGDSPEDQQAAVSVGAHYIARCSNPASNHSENPAYADFMNILEEIEKRYVV